MPTLGKSFETYDMIEEKKQLRIFKNYYFPVYIGRDLVREYKIEEKIYTKEQVKELFEEKIKKFFKPLHLRVQFFSFPAPM